ncbi:MAG: MAPEG family protein [Alphaproteobacteria bacterium]|nr:MAPEG family protein [Alphaproteobacteria bacterium]
MNTPFDPAAIAAVGIYAALCAFILFWLGNSTGALRRKHRVAVGDGGNKHLIRIMRGHGNAAENIPITLIMLAIAAMIGTPVFVLHILGILFVLGRILHAWHFIQDDAPGWQRFVGFGLSALVTLVLALGLAGHGVWLIFS